MLEPIRLISTDFDGTFFAEPEKPPVPKELERLVARLQASGVIWVINTGRDLSSLLQEMARAELSIWPDYVVAVEREIYKLDGSNYAGLQDWNYDCALAHEKVFNSMRKHVAGLAEWLHARFQAHVYEDPYSPFCVVAKSNGDADAIQEFLLKYAEDIEDLVVVRNDVYARFSHRAYNKGTALAEICRREGITSSGVLAAGDHLNDLPMLSTQYARWLIAPANAVELVKQTVRQQEGYLSSQACGLGLARGIEFFLEKTGFWKVKN